MRHATTYNPAALQTAYRPVGQLPLALLAVALTAAPVPAAVAQPTAYPRASYRPQPAELLPHATETPVFEETCLLALPTRSYRVKVKVKAVKRGHLQL